MLLIVVYTCVRNFECRAMCSFFVLRIFSRVRVAKNGQNFTSKRPRSRRPTATTTGCSRYRSRWPVSPAETKGPCSRRWTSRSSRRLKAAQLPSRDCRSRDQKAAERRFTRDPSSPPCLRPRDVFCRRRRSGKLSSKRSCTVSSVLCPYCKAEMCVPWNL